MALISTSELEEKRGIQRNLNTTTPSGNTDVDFRNKVPLGGYLKQGDSNYDVKKNENDKITSKDYIDATYIHPNAGYSSGKLYDSSGKEVQKDTDKTNILGYKKASNRQISKNKDYQYGKDSYNATSSMHDFDATRFYNMNILMGKNSLYNKGHLGQANVLNQQKMDFNVIDAEWVQSRYLVPDNEMEYVDSVNRFFSSTGWKFGSTRLGHSMAINPRPQFTRFADMKGNSRLDNIATTNVGEYLTNNSCYADVEVSMLPPKRDSKKDIGDRASFGYGMGRYYSEAIDDNATTIFLEFGLPKFNSMLSFFTRAIDGEDSMVANYGYVPVGYTLGKAGGYFAMFCAFPLMTIMIFVTKLFINFVASGPFQFYYMKPAMVQYWGVVNLIVNQMMTELGIFSPSIGEANPENQAEKIGMPVKMDDKDLHDLSIYMPGIFNPKSGYLDVYAVAQTSQAVVNAVTQAEYDYYGELGNALENKDLNANHVKGFVIKNLTNSVKYWPGGKVFNELDVKTRFSFLRKTYFNGIEDTIKSNGNKEAVPPNSIVVKGENGYEYEDVKQHLKSRKSDGNVKGLYSQRMDPNTGRVVSSVTEKGRKKTDDLDADTEILGKSMSEQEARTELSLDSNNFKANEDGTYNYTPNQGDASILQNIKDWLGNAGEYFDSAFRGGGSYAIFNVDYQGSASDSISNSYSDIDTGGFLNSVSQGARHMKFNLAGGNIFGGLQETLIKEVAGFISGAVEGVSYGLSNVVRTLLGGGYVDIPKKWDDSDIQLHSSSYTIDLVAPYGNIYSQIQNVYLPLAMLLAGSLPLATGKASYTSPFLCSLFNKGVQEIKLGMITSLSIERGTSNLPFTRNKRPLGIKVSFTVTDFSNLMAAPVKAGIIDSIFDFSLEDDTPFGRYIGVLCSRDLYSSKYLLPKLKKKLSRLRMALSQSASSAAMGMRIGHALEPLLGFIPIERNFNQVQLNDFRNFQESRVVKKAVDTVKAIFN